MATPLFRDLLRLARAAGIEVRHVALGGTGGGIASVRGRRQLFVDLDADPEDQLERTLSAVADLPEVLAQPMDEAMRKLILSRAQPRS